MDRCLVRSPSHQTAGPAHAVKTAFPACLKNTAKHHRCGENYGMPSHRRDSAGKSQTYAGRLGVIGRESKSDAVWNLTTALLDDLWLPVMWLPAGPSSHTIRPNFLPTCSFLHRKAAAVIAVKELESGLKGQWLYCWTFGGLFYI